MPRFNIDLMSGASEGDRRRAEHLCDVLTRIWPTIARDLEQNIATLINDDRGHLLKEVAVNGAEEVGYRVLCAVFANAAEKSGPQLSKLSFTLHKSDSTLAARNCKAQVDRMRKLLQEEAVASG